MPIAALFFLCSYLYGQERVRCIFDDFVQQGGPLRYELSTDSGLLTDHSTSSGLRSFHRVIPVYIHLVYRTEEPLLRRGHRGIPPRFFPHIASPQIELCPFERQSNEQVSLRIRRRKTAIRDIGDVHNGRVFFDSLGGSDAVDPTLYLNLWIAEMDDYALGYASFPDRAGTRTDGIILNVHYLLQPGAMIHKARTLIHELGHYLGLCHLAGCRTASCTDDDGIEDTPNSDTHYAWSTCPTPPQVRCGSEDMFMNYLTLAPDSCILFFTKGQVARMRHTLTTIRASLLQSQCPVPYKADPPWPTIRPLYSPYQQQLWLYMPYGFVHPTTCTIYATDGRVLARRHYPAGAHPTPIPVALAPGCYVLHFITEAQSYSTIFFVPPN